MPEKYNTTLKLSLNCSMSFVSNDNLMEKSGEQQIKLSIELRFPITVFFMSVEFIKVLASHR